MKVLQVYMLQFSSAAQSCPNLRPMDCYTLRFPVHHQLPEPTQAHVHWVSDAIQPSHPVLSPSPSTFNLSQDQGLFQWVSSLHQVAKILSVSFSISASNEYSGLISFRIDWIHVRWVRDATQPSHPLSFPFLLPSVFLSIRIFSSELTLPLGGQSIGALASASVLSVNIQDWFPLGLPSLSSLLSKGLSRIFSSTTIWKHQFFVVQLSLCSNSHIHTWLLEKP